MVDTSVVDGVGSEGHAAAETVRIAASETARLGGARFWGETSTATPDGETRVWSIRVGIVDLARCRADITETTGQAGIESSRELVEKLYDKLPWLLTDDEFKDIASIEKAYAQHVFIGGERFDSHPHFHEWYRREGDRLSRLRRRDDPVWIVDALRCADEASPAGAGQVRGADCARFGFHVDLERHRGQLEVHPKVGPLGAPHLTGEGIDEPGRIRRVTWREIPRERARFKLGRELDPVKSSQTTIELWDFGTSADIEPPEIRRPQPRPTKVVITLAKTFLELQRRKRQHDRSNEPPDET